VSCEAGHPFPPPPSLRSWAAPNLVSLLFHSEKVEGVSLLFHSEKVEGKRGGDKTKLGIGIARQKYFISLQPKYLKILDVKNILSLQRSSPLSLSYVLSLGRTNVVGLPTS